MKQPPLLGGIAMVRDLPLAIAAIASVLVAQPITAQEETSSKSPIAAIPQISEIEQPLTEAKWLTQASPPPEASEEQVARITGVQVKPTDQGLEVILETAGTFAEVLTSSTENSLITDIPNAQLRLSDGREFRQDNPTDTITAVTVTNLDAQTIRVTVTGKAGVPTAEVSQSPQALIFNVAAPAPQPTTPAPTAPPPTPASPPAEPQQKPEPQAEEEKPLELTVTAEREAEGYRVPNATSATRTDTPLRDIPQSIQVVPEQILEDQQAIRLRDALRNVSGVQPGNTIGNLAEFPRIRGFTQFEFLRNGFRDFGDLIRETANVERIEVLKGPGSVLYGNLEPGGIVNLVTKQPLSEPFYSAELQAGSFSFVRPTIDLSGPLNSERSLLYRLNAAYERDDGFRDFNQGIERIFVSPVLAWQISDRTDLTLDLEYLDYEQPFDRGIVAIGTGVADIPFDRVLGELDDVTITEAFNTGYQLEHRFSENWTLSNAFRFSSRKNTIRQVDSDSLDEQTGELTRTWFDVVDNDERYSLQTNLVGKFATGSVRHTLLFGTDLFRDILDLSYKLGPAPSINIFNPVYGTVRRPDRDELPDAADIDTTTDILGIYLQDQITLLDNLKLLASGRFDIVDQESNNQGVFGDADTQQQDKAFTPRIGIVYQPIEPLSLYASYSQSFTPNVGAVTVGGSLLEPQRGTQYEVGIRGELLDNRLSANLAAYHLTRSNVATADPDNPNFSIATGEQRSQGIELDVAGEILPGWNVIASYAYTDAKITEDGGSPREGNIPFSVPFNASSLWTTYEIQSGDLRGLGFGLGLFFVSEREGDDDNSFQVPSYLRTDASIFYRRNNWRTGINFKNLFDVDYIEATQFRTAINPGAPFTVLGSVSVEF